MNNLALHPTGRASGTEDACLFGLSLCSGTGGLDLGLTIAIPGYRAVGYVERETYAAAILVARMEDAALDQAVVWDDVATFDDRPWRGAVDILSAGYPCQPFSVAGKRLGNEDPRHLWPHVVRHARAITFQLAEVAVTGTIVRAILAAIRRLWAPPSYARSPGRSKSNETGSTGLPVALKNPPNGPRRGRVATSSARQGAFGRGHTHAGDKMLDHGTDAGDLTLERQATWGMSD